MIEINATLCKMNSLLESVFLNNGGPRSRGSGRKRKIEDVEKKQQKQRKMKPKMCNEIVNKFNVIQKTLRKV